MVKPAEAEKNLAWEAAQAAKQNAPADADLLALGLGDVGLTAAAAAIAAPTGPLRLQVTGFKQGMAENDLKLIFEPFGALDSISVVRDAAGQPISIAYLVYTNAADGRNAMNYWHNRALAEDLLSVTEAPLQTPAPAPGPIVGVGELDDDDGGLKIDAQVRQGCVASCAWHMRHLLRACIRLLSHVCQNMTIVVSPANLRILMQ